MTATLNGDPIPGGTLVAPVTWPGSVNVGATKYYTFSWGTHAKFAVGDVIEITACVVGIPGNPPRPVLHFKPNRYALRLSRTRERSCGMHRR